MAEGRPGDNGKREDGQGGPEGGQGQGRRFGRRRGYRGRSRRDRSGEAQVDKAQDRALPGGQAAPGPQDAVEPQEPRETPTCPLCQKPIYDLSTALSSSKEEGDPAHFDCVLDRVAAAETLEPGEKVVYLGSGTFAVVSFKDKAEAAFTVKRRIQWEKEGEKKDWRKTMSSRIANL